ncbi:sulfite exporter TauE/SafE family protein [bacterium]|nr:sulfite exporter TauE/SafE family protein [bacterium]
MEYFGAVLLALWLGVLTSISPCPLATNIAAISYIGRRVERPALVLLTGLLYTLGRTLVYVALAVLIVASLLAIPQVSAFLRHYMDLVLGPLLIIVGMFLLELISFSKSGGGISPGLQAKVDRAGVWGGLLLGMLFALSFCPTSAALFFGSLISLATDHNSRVVLPLLYGVGTAVPVVVFAVIIALGAQYLSKAFNVLSQIELWARRITGAVFLLVGIFYCLRYAFGVV